MHTDIFPDVLVLLRLLLNSLSIHCLRISTVGIWIYTETQHNLTYKENKLILCIVCGYATRMTHVRMWCDRMFGVFVFKTVLFWFFLCAGRGPSDASNIIINQAHNKARDVRWYELHEVSTPPGAHDFDDGARLSRSSSTSDAIIGKTAKVRQEKDGQRYQ